MKTILRTMMRFAVIIAAVLLMSPVAEATEPPLERIRLPKGFSISLYANVPGARSMAVVEKIGVVFVGTRSDSIYAVIDKDRDGRPEQVVRVRSGLKVANGIDWRNNWLYVAEQHRVVRFSAPDLKTLMTASPQVLFDNLPDDPWHGWRYARFGPDGGFYIAIGSPCNICRTNGLEGTIVRMAPGGGKPEIIASGVRNSVGFDFQPTTG
ncbi:MAG: hypothetical protein O3B76_11310, partial [Proteobacteria bacterium]|nr:hypothetical protein [Pseudomonadota bacterium]